jgi:acylphosphatase
MVYFMSNQMALHAVVHGHVQGVFFRAFVAEKATELELTGYVCNLPSGRDVEVRAEGEKEQIDTLAGYLKIGPTRALVEEVTTTWSKFSGKYTRFTIQ